MKPIKQGESFLPNLPNVGGYQLIDASHINRLSKAISKYSILSAVGAQVKRTERGSSIVVRPPFDDSHPFQVVVNADGVFVREGYVFSAYDQFSSSEGGTQGLPITCSAIGATYEDNEPFGSWFWPHPDKTNSYKVSIVFTNGPAELRYSTHSATEAEWERQFGASEYPIAWVVPMGTSGKSFMVEQIISTNIFAYKRSHAFKVTAFELPTYNEDEEGNTIAGPSEIRLKVAAGTVNGIRPSYDGTGMVGDGYNSISYGTGVNEEKYVYLEIKLEPKPSDYPAEVKVKIATELPTNDNEKAYIALALVNVVRASVDPSSSAYNIKHVSIQQMCANSLFASAHRVVPNSVNFYFGAI